MPFRTPDDLHAAFAAAFQAADTDALVDLYEDGAVQVQADGSTTGRDGLSKVFDNLLAAGLAMRGDPRAAIIIGDLALTSTRYASDSDDSEGQTIVTAEVSRRQSDGSWKVVIDVPFFAAS